MLKVKIHLPYNSSQDESYTNMYIQNFRLTSKNIYTTFILQIKTLVISKLYFMLFDHCNEFSVSFWLQIHNNSIYLRISLFGIKFVWN